MTKTKQIITINASDLWLLPIAIGATVVFKDGANNKL